MTRRATVSEDRARTAVVDARRRARRAWLRYLAAAVPMLLLVGGFAGLVYRTSEIRAVRITTSTQPATALPGGGLPVRMSRRWNTTDRLAIGTPVWLDVVITYSERTVTGRDAATGRPRWTYTRSDRRICSVAQDGGMSVALYAHDGNCDEATGLDSAVGGRRWVRTLFDSGTDVTVSVISGQILLSTPGATNLIDVINGLDRWYDPQNAGCVTRSAVLGTTGVLLASACTGGQDTLSLRGGQSDKKRDWSVPLTGRVPLTADTVVSVLSRDGSSVEVLGKTGRRTSTTRIPRGLSAPGRPLAYDTLQSNVELVAVGAGVLALHDVTGAFRWQRAMPALPVQTSAGLLLAVSGHVQILAAPTGRVTTTVPAAGVQPGDQLGLLGRGVVVANAAGTSAFS